MMPKSKAMREATQKANKAGKSAQAAYAKINQKKPKIARKK